MLRCDNPRLTVCGESLHRIKNKDANAEGLLGNYGTEKDTNFKYHNGNDEPQGFGHICITVDDMEKACQRFEEQGVQWKKRMTDGRMKNIAFILDPDDYWIEVSYASTVLHDLTEVFVGRSK